MQVRGTYGFAKENGLKVAFRKMEVGLIQGNDQVEGYNIDTK
jgi:hypothetical protein